MKEKILADFHRKRAGRVIENMKRRNIDGAYFPDRRGAISHICGLIPAGATVGLGGSVTIVESGLVDALRGLDAKLLDRYKDGVSPEEVFEMRRRGMTADVFIASCNAISYDGRLVNQDGLGNRVGGIIFGPEKVILMAGMNKLVPTVEDGARRIKEYVAPLNSVRFGADTPCARTGFCDDEACFPPSRICNQLTVIEASAAPGRITVVLVGEELGF